MAGIVKKAKKRPTGSVRKEHKPTDTSSIARVTTIRTIERRKQGVTGGELGIIECCRISRCLGGGMRCQVGHFASQPALVEYGGGGPAARARLPVGEGGGGADFCSCHHQAIPFTSTHSLL